MKKIFLFIAFLWISLVSFAQDGVNFEHLSFREALDKAKIRLNANVNFDLTMELLFLTIKENLE